MQNQTGAAISVHAIADGKAEAVEFVVDANTPNCGKPLKELKLKSGVLLVSITHGTVTELPNGNSSFNVGDNVVVVSTGKDVLLQLGDIFA
jgi:trk system potassium uptake protein TrkA